MNTRSKPDPSSSEACGAELHIADDYGDNHVTVRCGLRLGHQLPHREDFKRNDTPVAVTFECDERRVESATPQGVGGDSVEPTPDLDEYGLPSMAWCASRVIANSATALERFIYDNEPVTPGSPGVRAGAPDARFRKGLAAVLAEAEGAHIRRAATESTMTMDIKQMKQLQTDVATLRSSFKRNKSIMRKALQAQGLPDSWLEGWEEKLDRMFNTVSAGDEPIAPQSASDDFGLR